MGFIITLILVGLVLMFAEILIIPGVGVAGILGLLSLGGSCFYAFYEFGNTVGAIVTGVNVLLLVALAVWILRAKTWKRMSLETNIDSKVDSAPQEKGIEVGSRGIAVTRLAPAGKVQIGEEVLEAFTRDSLVEPGKGIEVVEIEDNKVFVKEI